jgi:S-adenosylmethionine decarboxylase proenzyme
MCDALGRHVLLELSGCPFTLLNDIGFIRLSFLEAARRAEVTVLSENFNMFNPQGVSGVLVIAESHISVHTWPEYGYAAIDVFTCGDNALPDRAVEFLTGVFRPSESRNYVIRRGMMEEGFPSARCEIEERRLEFAGSSL